MNRFLFLIMLIAGIFSCSFLNAQNAKKQSDEIFFADPTIFHEKGKFYLTGTRGRAPLGFSVLESTNLPVS